jgi:putative isomerase
MGRRDLSPERHWNTWDSRYPLAWVHLPSGLTLRPAAFSTKAGTGSALEVSGAATLRLGPHHLTGRYVAGELELAGTRIGLEWAKADPFTWVARARWLAAGEWPLRFWLIWALGFSDPSLGRVALGPGAEGLVRGRPAPGEGGPSRPEEPHLLATWRSQVMALTARPAPLAAGLHPSPEALLAQMEREGYFAPGSEGGPWGALRLNGEEMPESFLALGTAHHPEEAARRSRAALGAAEAILDEARRDLERGPAVQLDGYRGGLEAVRDVLAWNTVWDPGNGRTYTTLTRRWVAAKFGGWFVWLDDVLYHGLMAAWAGDAVLARRNLETALFGLTPDGNLPCLLAENTEWVDRSQPPVAAWITWQVSRLLAEPSLVREAFPLLRSAHDWWFDHRSPKGGGLLTYGSTPTGSGMFAGTRLAAKDESAMDNSPMYDAARFDPEARTLALWDVAPSSLAVLEAQCLARMAEELGEPEEAARLRRRGEALAEAVRRELWDEARGIFANRPWPGEEVREPVPTSPTSFFPLLAGIATPAQAERMVQDHLLPRERFGGEPMLPATPRDEAGYGDQVYWRGRVWPPLVYLTYLGLRRYRLDGVASLLAERSLALFAREWSRRGHCHENYHGDTGEGDDGADSDPFYTWGALMPALALQELACLTPWDGLSLGRDGGEGHLRGWRALGRLWEVEVGPQGLRVAVDGAVWIRSPRPLRLYGVELAEGALRLAVRQEQGELILRPGGRILERTAEGGSATWEETAEGWRVRWSGLTGGDLRLGLRWA